MAVPSRVDATSAVDDFGHCWGRKRRVLRSSRSCDQGTASIYTHRRFHSTETALLRVMSDILKAADQQQVTLLGLLDLSAAFDCVDREILLARL